MKEVLVVIDLMDRANSIKKMDKLFMEYGKIHFLKKYYDIVSYLINNYFKKKIN